MRCAAFSRPETTLFQYTSGADDPSRVSPDGRTLDDFYLARPGADEIQLDLLLRLPDECRGLRRLPGLLPRPSAAAARYFGPQRSVLPSGWRGSLQARFAEGGRPFRELRPLRAGDPRSRDRRSHGRFPRSSPVTRTSPGPEDRSTISRRRATFLRGQMRGRPCRIPPAILPSTRAVEGRPGSPRLPQGLRRARGLRRLSDLGHPRPRRLPRRD